METTVQAKLDRLSILAPPKVGDLPGDYLCSLLRGERQVDCFVRDHSSTSSLTVKSPRPVASLSGDSIYGTLLLALGAFGGGTPVMLDALTKDNPE